MKYTLRTNLFFILVFLEGIASNLVHPVTPSLIISLELPSFIFGLAFACMATTSLLFSQFWGKMNENIGSRKVFLITCIGYAIGQFLFLNANSVPQIIIARLCSGMFTGGIIVSMMTYLVKTSEEDILSKNLTIYATLLAMGSASGYLIGGVIGKNNIYIPFYIQVIMLFSQGIFFYNVCIKKFDNKIIISKSIKTFLNSTPVNTFKEMKPHLNSNLIILSIVALCISTATTGQDQNFNYYIKDALNLDSSYNGFVKSAVAILGFILNATLCKYIIEKLNISKSLRNIYFFLSAIALIIFFVYKPYPYIFINIIYYSFIILCTPLLQYLFTNTNKKVEAGHIIGYYNTLNSLGMIIGSLSAGALYDFSGKLPLLFCSILLIFCGLLIFIQAKKSS